MTDVEDKEGQVVWEKELRLELSIFHVSQPVSEFRRTATVAPEIRETLTALVINVAACCRWLCADPPNIREARSATERISSNANALTGFISASRHDYHG